MNNHLIDLYKFNISQAISDYFLHSSDPFILKDFSENFINRLALDSFNAKADLRNLFSSFPVWNVYLQALVINGSRTHNPNFRADIKYPDSDDLKEKSEEFETEICLDLDNLHSGNFDYDFSYDGISDVSADDIPDWIFDQHITASRTLWRGL